MVGVIEKITNSYIYGHEIDCSCHNIRIRNKKRSEHLYKLITVCGELQVGISISEGAISISQVSHVKDLHSHLHEGSGRHHKWKS